MTNQVVIYFSQVGRGARTSILLVQVRYAQVTYSDTLKVYWNFDPLVSALFLASTYICVFLCDLTLLWFYKKYEEHLHEETLKSNVAKMFVRNIGIQTLP